MAQKNKQTTIIYLKHLKPANYDTHLFALLGYDPVSNIKELVKTYNGRDYLYLKNKVLNGINLDNQELVLKIKMDTFTNNEGKVINYISATRDKTKKHRAELTRISKENYDKFLETRQQTEMSDSDSE